MNELEKIYEGIYAELKCDSEEIMSADDRLTEYMEGMKLQEEKKAALGDLIVDYAIACEKQRFLEGFRCAVKLFTC